MLTSGVEVGLVFPQPDCKQSVLLAGVCWVVEHGLSLTLKQRKHDTSVSHKANHTGTPKMAFSPQLFTILTDLEEHFLSLKMEHLGPYTT